MKLAYFVGGPFDLTKMTVLEEKQAYIFYARAADESLSEQVYKLVYVNKMGDNDLLLYTYEGANYIGYL